MSLINCNNIIYENPLLEILCACDNGGSNVKKLQKRRILSEYQFITQSHYLVHIILSAYN